MPPPPPPPLEISYIEHCVYPFMNDCGVLKKINRLQKSMQIENYPACE